MESEKWHLLKNYYSEKGQSSPQRRLYYTNHKVSWPLSLLSLFSFFALFGLLEPILLVSFLLRDRGGRWSMVASRPHLLLISSSSQPHLCLISASSQPHSNIRDSWMIFTVDMNEWLNEWPFPHVLEEWLGEWLAFSSLSIVIRYLLLSMTNDQFRSITVPMTAYQWPWGPPRTSEGRVRTSPF